MKRLYLIRHAKSSWEFDVADNKRPLNDRGITDAKNIGDYLSNKKLEIDRMFSSPAVRAKTTAAIIQEALSIPNEKFELVEKLYDFNGDKVLAMIHALNNKYDSIMIFGHNHAFTTLANKLGDKKINNVPTAGVVALQFTDDSWNTIKKGKTEFTIFPKALRK